MDVLTKLNTLINEILYEDQLVLSNGTPVTEQQRLYFVEYLEFVKKTTYLLMGRDYEIPKHIVNKKDVAYQLKQLMYELEVSSVVKIGEKTLNNEQRQSMYRHLERTFHDIKRINAK